MVQVILVGHSAGGLSLSDAIHRYGKKKIKLAIFIAATMLKSGYLTNQDLKHVSTPIIIFFLFIYYIYSFSMLFVCMLAWQLAI